MFQLVSGDISQLCQGFFWAFAYIQLGELIQNTLQTLVKVLLGELDLAHVEVTDTTDGKVGMDDLCFMKRGCFVIELGV